MSVFSTMDITRERAIEIIRDRMQYIDDPQNMSDDRVIAILEKMVQVDSNDPACDQRDYHEPLAYNNFWIVKP